MGRRMLTRQRLEWVVIACTLALGCGGGPRAKQTKPVQVPQGAEMRLQPYQGSMPSLPVEVGGHTLPMLFDTGAGLTTITPAVAEELGCQPYGRVLGFRMGGERVQMERCDNVTLTIHGVPLHHATVGVYDVMTLLPKDWPQVAGVVSLSSFEGHALTVALAEQRLVLESPESLQQRTGEMSPVRTRWGRQQGGLALDIFLPVSISGGQAWFEMDSGTLGPTILAPHTAKALGVDLDGPGVIRHAPRKGQPAWWEVGQVQLDLVGGEPVQTKAVVEEIIYDGVLGVQDLQRWIITLDLKQPRAWVAPTTTVASVD